MSEERTTGCRAQPRLPYSTGWARVRIRPNEQQLRPNEQQLRPLQTHQKPTNYEEVIKIPGNRYTSFPCIICGKELLRGMNEYEAQPDDGIMCETGGNYGSRVFDDMGEGHRLAFNICDPCMVHAGEQGRVMTYRRSRPVEVDVLGRVGYEDIDRPYIPWHTLLPAGEDDHCYLDLLDLRRYREQGVPRTIHIRIPLDVIIQRIEEDYAQETN